MSEKPYYGSERTPPKVFEFEENLKRFFEDYRMVDELPIITGKLHPTVYQEILDLETRLWEQNQHELGAFKYHLNVGENLGQASIGYEEARRGFLLSYVYGICSTYLERIGFQSFRESWTGINYKLAMTGFHHSNETGWWLNWADKNSVNVEHNHPSTLTSVVYVKNSTLAPTYFYKDGEIVYTHRGQDGDIVLFPGWLNHSVGKIEEDGIRVTAALNINLLNRSNPAYGIEGESKYIML